MMTGFLHIKTNWKKKKKRQKEEEEEWGEGE